MTLLPGYLETVNTVNASIVWCGVIQQTYNFSFLTQEGMAFHRLILNVPGNVCKHFLLIFVRCTEADSARYREVTGCCYITTQWTSHKPLHNTGIHVHTCITDIHIYIAFDSFNTCCKWHRFNMFNLVTKEWPYCVCLFFYLLYGENNMSCTFKLCKHNNQFAAYNKHC